MGRLRLAGSSKSYVFFAKITYKRDYILQKRPVFLKSLPIEATPQQHTDCRALLQGGVES